MIMYVMRNKESLSGHLPPRYLKYMEAFCLLRCHNVTFWTFSIIINISFIQVQFLGLLLRVTFSLDIVC